MPRYRRATFPRAEDACLISCTRELSANYGVFPGRVIYCKAYLPHGHAAAALGTARKIGPMAARRGTKRHRRAGDHPPWQ